MDEQKTRRPFLGKPLLGAVAALALMLGLAGATVMVGGTASAQSPTSTATASATTPRASVTAPSTGTGVAASSGDSSLVTPLAILGVIVLGGGAAFAIASRNRG